MTYIQVKDLKKTKELWRRLEQEGELVITRDGQPRAILIGIEPDELESALTEIRRSLFSGAIRRVRERAVDLPAADDVVAQSIREARQTRR